jgi:hypothetical protein
MHLESGLINYDLVSFIKKLGVSNARILLRPALRDYGGQVAPAYANLLRQGYGGQEASAGRPTYAEAPAGRHGV